MIWLQDGKTSWQSSFLELQIYNQKFCIPIISPLVFSVTRGRYVLLLYMFCTCTCFALVCMYLFCSGATKGALCATGSKLCKPSGSTTGPPGRVLLSYLDTSFMFKIFCCCKIVSKPSGSTARQPVVLSSSYLTSYLFLPWSVQSILIWVTFELSYIDQTLVSLLDQLTHCSRLIIPNLYIFVRICKPHLHILSDVTGNQPHYTNLGQHKLIFLRKNM